MTSMKSTLRGLPVELQATILSHLSAGQVQRFRRVCSHFKAVIDKPGNHVILLKPTVAMHTARIAKSINQLLHYPVDQPDSFVTALINFCNHRGIDCQGAGDLRGRGTRNRRWCEVRAFVNSWENRTDHVTNSFERQRRRSGLFITANAIIEAHSDHHAPYLGPDLIWSTVYKIHDAISFQTRVSRDTARELHLETIHECQEVLDRIQCTPNGIFADSPTFASLEDGLPSFYLTTVSASEFPNGHEEWSRRHRQPIASVGELADMFGLPTFNSEFFGLCVRTEWAYKRLKNALVESGPSLSPVEKLAILEDLYFF